MKFVPSYGMTTRSLTPVRVLRIIRPGDPRRSREASAHPACRIVSLRYLAIITCRIMGF